MKNLKEIKEILQRHRAKLESNYGLNELGIFGSYIKNEDIPFLKKEIEKIIEANK